MLARRKLLQLGFGAAVSAAGASLMGQQAMAQGIVAVADNGPRAIAFHNLHTGEKLDAIYWDQGRYVPDAVAAVNKVLRDFRTNDQHMMDPRLLDLLSTVNGKVGCGSKPFQVISGYRSPKTNAMLHERSGQVAGKSLHMQGMAVDVRVEGVGLQYLQKAALGLGRGGVGFYPTSNFVHMDVGRVRQWTGS